MAQREKLHPCIIKKGRMSQQEENHDSFTFPTQRSLEMRGGCRGAGSRKDAIFNKSLDEEVKHWKFARTRRTRNSQTSLPSIIALLTLFTLLFTLNLLLSLILSQEWQLLYHFPCIVNLSLIHISEPTRPKR